MGAPRVALVGPRRVRQGLGPFVARELERSGAEVPCFLCGSASSIEAGRRELAEVAGIEARGYADPADLTAAEGVDALAILSPAETHAAYLELAIGRGWHVLCEKPLVWGGHPVVRAREIVARFRARGLLLMENCQWPETLPSFFALHPEVAEETPSRFAMRLSPTRPGLEMLVDSLSHPISLLQHWIPDSDGRVENATIEANRDASVVGIAFDYRTPLRSISCRVDLVRKTEQPREAGYALNGRWARRVVEMSDYSMFFADGERQVALPDPLASLVARFVARLRQAMGGEVEPASESLVRRLAMLETLTRAFVASQGSDAQQ